MQNNHFLFSLRSPSDSLSYHSSPIFIIASPIFIVPANLLPTSIFIIPSPFFIIPANLLLRLSTSPLRPSLSSLLIFFLRPSSSSLRPSSSSLNRPYAILHNSFAHHHPVAHILHPFVHIHHPFIVRMLFFNFLTLILAAIKKGIEWRLQVQIAF